MICIRYNNGRVLQGVLLTFGEHAVRVAVQGSDDAVEFRMIHEVWVSDDCEVVKMAFMERFAAAETGETDLLAAVFGSSPEPISIQRVM